MADNIRVRVSLVPDRKSVKTLRDSLQKSLSNVEVKLNQASVNKAVKQLRAAFNKGINVPIKINTTQAVRANKETQKLGKNMETATRKTREYTGATREASAATLTFAERVGFSTNRLAAYLIPAAAIFNVTRAFTAAKDAIVDINRDIIRLTQIFEGNSTRAAQVSRDVLQIAQQFGQSGRELLNITTLLAQSGRQFASNNDLLAATEALARTPLAATFGDITETTKGTIAALNQFNLAGSETGRVLDVANELAKNFAVQAADIFTAVQTGGKAFQIGGGTIEQFSALVAAARQLTGISARTVGTGFNTIFLRLLRPENIRFLDQLTGGNIRDAQGNLRNITQILLETGKAFGNLNKESKAAASERLFGTRQGKIGIPLLEDIGQGADQSVVISALNKASEGAGSLARDSVQGLERIDVILQQVGSRFEEVFGTLARDPATIDFFKQIASFAGSFADALQAISPIIPSLLRLGTVGIGFSAIRGAAGFARGLGRIGAGRADRVSISSQASAAMAPIIAPIKGNTAAINNLSTVVAQASGKASAAISASPNRTSFTPFSDRSTDPILDASRASGRSTGELAILAGSKRRLAKQQSQLQQRQSVLNQQKTAAAQELQNARRRKAQLLREIRNTGGPSSAAIEQTLTGEQRRQIATSLVGPGVLGGQGLSSQRTLRRTLVRSIATQGQLGEATRIDADRLIGPEVKNAAARLRSLARQAELLRTRLSTLDKNSKEAAAAEKELATINKQLTATQRQRIRAGRRELTGAQAGVGLGGTGSRFGREAAVLGFGGAVRRRLGRGFSRRNIGALGRRIAPGAGFAGLIAADALSSRVGDRSALNAQEDLTNQLIQNENKDVQKNALQFASSFALIGGLIGGPVGAGVGIGLGAIAAGLQSIFTESSKAKSALLEAAGGAKTLAESATFLEELADRLGSEGFADISASAEGRSALSNLVQRTRQELTSIVSEQGILDPDILIKRLTGSDGLEPALSKAQIAMLKQTDTTKSLKSIIEDLVGPQIKFAEQQRKLADAQQRVSDVTKSLIDRMSNLQRELALVAAERSAELTLQRQIGTAAQGGGPGSLTAFSDFFTQDLINEVRRELGPGENRNIRGAARNLLPSEVIRGLEDTSDIIGITRNAIEQIRAGRSTGRGFNPTDADAIIRDTFGGVNSEIGKSIRDNLRSVTQTDKQIDALSLSPVEAVLKQVTGNVDILGVATDILRKNLQILDQEVEGVTLIYEQQAKIQSTFNQVAQERQRIELEAIGRQRQLGLTTGEVLSRLRERLSNVENPNVIGAARNVGIAREIEAEAARERLSRGDLVDVVNKHREAVRNRLRAESELENQRAVAARTTELLNTQFRELTGRIGETQQNLQKLGTTSLGDLFRTATGRGIIGGLGISGQLNGATSIQELLQQEGGTQRAEDISRRVANIADPLFKRATDFLNATGQQDQATLLEQLRGVGRGAILGLNPTEQLNRLATDIKSAADLDKALIKTQSDLTEATRQLTTKIQQIVLPDGFDTSPGVVAATRAVTAENQTGDLAQLNEVAAQLGTISAEIADSRQEFQAMVNAFRDFKDELKDLDANQVIVDGKIAFEGLSNVQEVGVAKKALEGLVETLLNTLKGGSSASERELVNTLNKVQTLLNAQKKKE